MSHRWLMGLSVGSGLDGITAVTVRAAGVGLDLSLRVERVARVPFPPSVAALTNRSIAGREPPSPAHPIEWLRGIAEAAVQAARTVTLQVGLSPHDVFAAGLLEPSRLPADVPMEWSEIAEHLAEQTGITVLHGFRGRDRAAGGTGQPITAVADYLLFKHASEDRLLIHLGAVTGILLIPAGAKMSAIHGFGAGPGNQLLDAILTHGTRGRETADPGGKKAVQGCCVESLLARWAEHPYLMRKPPKAVPADAFSRAFVLAAFDTARKLEMGLPDLLCTATHFIARSVGDACRSWLPAPVGARRVLLTGSGVHNGFLFQRLGQQFAGWPMGRSDEAGVPALARNATAAAVLAALTCDGVPGNVPFLTGATGGRLLGNIVPGDGRNWVRCAAAIADPTGDNSRLNRAA